MAAGLGRETGDLGTVQPVKVDLRFGRACKSGRRSLLNSSKLSVQRSTLGGLEAWRPGGLTRGLAALYRDGCACRAPVRLERASARLQEQHRGEDS